MVLIKETPADLIEDNSYFSDILPKTITEEINIVKGIAMGISFIPIKNNNSMI